MRSIPAFVLALALGSSMAHAGPDEQRRAEELFQKSETLYQAGDFRGAIALLEEANRLSPHPVLVYNLARAHESLGEKDRAIAYYRRYLELDPKAADKGAVNARIETLTRESAPAPTASPTSTSTSTVPVKPPTAPTSASPSPVPWIVAGTGALGLGAGAVLGGLALSKQSEAEDATIDGVETSRLSGAADDLALGATIAFVAGGVVAGAGIVWGIIDVATSSDGAPDDISARLTITPGGLVIRGVF